VFDVMAAMILWLVIVNRRETSSRPLLFGLVLALLVVVPLAYVMTNFGTLIRLRLLVAAPIWLLTLALAPGFAARPAPSVPAPNQSPAGIPARSDEH
jgi:multisubunit Na+/H+ antiporter MnhE subunit